MSRDKPRAERQTTDKPSAVKNPVEARAGLVSGRVIAILLVGTLLAVAFLGLAWALIGD